MLEKYSPLIDGQPNISGFREQGSMTAASLPNGTTYFNFVRKHLLTSWRGHLFPQ